MKKLKEVAPDTELGNVIMKCVRYFLLVMLPLLMYSCHEKTKTIRPVFSTIEGSLNEYFEVVNKDYKIFDNHVNIEFVRIKGGWVEPQITAVFLDDKGNEIATSEVNLNNDAEELGFLLANKVGESSTLTFSFGDIIPNQVKFISPMPNVDIENTGITDETEEPEVLDEEVGEEVEEEVDEESVDSLFSEQETALEDEIEEEEEDNAEEESVEEEQQVQTNPVLNSNSKNWDKVLDDYESYVDQYISLMKKALGGDLSAMTEYMSLLEKAEELEKELDESKNDLSVAQMHRLAKITQKLANAALNM